MNKNTVHKLTLSGVLLSIGLVLPFVTGGIPEIGNMLLPMHLPVLLAGLLVGAFEGGLIGATLPILRSLIFGMPVMYPSALAMAFELLSYGLVAGLMSRATRKLPRIVGCYISLVLSMIAGRAVWGCAMLVLTGLSGGTFTFSAFVAASLTNAIPGIIIQLILIPLTVAAAKKARLLPESEKGTE